MLLQCASRRELDNGTADREGWDGVTVWLFATDHQAALDGKELRDCPVSHSPFFSPQNATNNQFCHPNTLRMRAVSIFFCTPAKYCDWGRPLCTFQISHMKGRSEAAV